MFIQSALNDVGQVQAVDTGTVSSFIAGQGYVLGSPLVTDEAVSTKDTLSGGFRYRYDGALRIHDATLGVPAKSFISQGLRVTGVGQLCVILDDPSDAFSLAGVAVAADGRVFMNVPA